MVLANSFRVALFVSFATLLSAQQASDAMRLLQATASKYQNLDSYEYSAVAIRPMEGGFTGKAQLTVGYASPKMTPSDAPVPLLNGEQQGLIGVFDPQGKPGRLDLHSLAMPGPAVSFDEIALRIMSANITGTETVHAHPCQIVTVQYEGKRHNPNGDPVRYWIDPETHTIWKMQYSEIDILSKTGGLARWTVTYDSWAQNQPPSAWLLQHGQFPAKERTTLVGQSAPEITGKSLSGDPFRLSRLKDKVVVLDFWGTYCGPCNTEMASLERLKASVSDKSVEIWSITQDAQGAAKRWLAERGRTLPSAIVAKDSAFQSYGIDVLPELVIIDRKGVVAHHWVGLKKESDVNQEIAALLQD